MLHQAVARTCRDARPFPALKVSVATVDSIVGCRVNRK